MSGIYRLHGVVKHYDWGGYSFIPALLKAENKPKKPFAEYWMGIHPLGMAGIDTGGSSPTDLAFLAPDLSYLFKILDVRDMLSIQVHPSKEAAETEFKRENAEGIPIDSPQRCYKDPNHKPELMVALGDFWLLHGFKPTEELTDTLLNIAELRELLPVFNNSGYPGLFKHVMEITQEEVNRILKPLIDSLNKIYESGEMEKSSPDYWAAKAHKTFSSDGNIDRGIFSIYFFNLIHLKKGEGIFQAAGVPHAYLEGQNVEIMANSDNVLRGGLTTKQINVKELMKHVKCEATYPQILSPEADNEGERKYETPVDDFRLSVFELEAGDIVSFYPQEVETVLLTEGITEIDNENDTIRLQAGSPAAVVFPGDKVYLAAAAKSFVFRASGRIHNR
ncbi:MAG TPA: mannose-6-phosphate isomerase, class I [Chitinophagaceae bacterium]|mgnify:CR=1 FL=1|nr:mannose-6-phosphate isomerase, class I [Chitinophagaceae bacterium]